MAQTYLSRFLAVMRDNERRMTALFEALATYAAGQLARRADADGTVPRAATFDVQQAVGERVTATFLGRNRAGQRAAFEILPDGTVFPLSPYAQALWAGITAATRIPVAQHASLMERRLSPDVLAALRQAQRNPFAVAQAMVTEQTVVFRPNPLAQYDPPHTWVDPNGHTLSDRIWNAAGNTRRRLDLFLERAIAEGRGALDISRDLETFLLPGRQLRTKAPYGTDASFDAMRLARTEITRAHSQAAEVSAMMNPFVEGMKVVLSLSHPKPDICDEAAAAGPWPKDEIPEQYRIPLHPQCLCHYAYVMVEDPQALLDEFRADVRRTRQELADKIGPVQVDEFTRLLLRDTPLEEVAVVEPAPVEILTHGDGFPIDLGRLEDVRGLGGSTGARLVKDPATGAQYVLKRGASPDHVRSEFLADELYRAMGVNVPKARLYEMPDGPVKLAEFIEGRTLAELRQTDKRAYNRAVKALKKDFAKDALLGNWDVLGLSYDNILVDGAGNAWRIDNGGALLFRAQGAAKPAWGRYVDEIWTLRNAQTNAVAASVFGDLPYKDILRQLRGILKDRRSIEELLDVHDASDALRTLMRSRLDSLEDYVGINRTLSRDAWNEGYIESFTRHVAGLRNADIIDKLPKTLTNRGVTVFDESGQIWDNLRNPKKESIIADLSRYMAQQGGDYNVVTYWSQRQAADSWTGAAQATKYFYASRRNIDLDEAFWWKTSVSEARDHYEGALRRLGQAKYDETLTIWHAFNYEFVRNVEFAGNNRARGLVKLIRTENKVVMDLNGLARGQTGAIKRGAVESTSLFERVSVFGSEVTTQQVPHHRIFGNYMFEREPGYNGPLFLSDRENEIVAMMDGVKVKYERR